jgi:hypothetical protein
LPPEKLFAVLKTLFMIQVKAFEAKWFLPLAKGGQEGFFLRVQAS